MLSEECYGSITNGSTLNETECRVAGWGATLTLKLK